MDKELQLLTIEPDKSLSDFVDVFYFFENPSDNGIEIASLPDRKDDLIFISETKKNYF